MDSNTLIQIGKIGRPHSYRGECRVWLFNDNAILVTPEKRLFLDKNRREEVFVTSMRPADRFLLVAFEGYESREDVAELVNKPLYVPRNELPETDEDEFYCHDLIGFKVFAPPCPEDENVELGQVVTFLDKVETDVMVIEGRRLKGRWLIPFLRDVVLKVDLKNEAIYLAPLDVWTHEDQILLS